MLGTFFDARLNDKSQYPVAAKSGEYNTRCKPDQLTGNDLHAPSEIGVDSFQADRSPTHMYRTAPLAPIGAARAVASTTTAAPRPWMRSFNTMTRTSTWDCRHREGRN